MKKTILSLFFLTLFVNTHAQIITTIAGNDSVNYCCDGELAIHAGLNRPDGMVVDTAGNIFIADAGNNRIRKINVDGIITTIAGTGIAGYNGDGIAATSAQLNYPAGIALDSLGNLYICDDYNFRVRMINTAGIISTIIGTGVEGYNGDNMPAISAEIGYTFGIAVDPNNIYIPSDDSARIRKVNRSTGIITTIAGNGSIGHTGDGGPATAGKITHPTSVAVDRNGNVYFSEYSANYVRKINTAGILSTIGGNGTSGNAGDNGPAINAQFSWPHGLKVDDQENVYIADVNNNQVRKIDAAGIITTIAGTGVSGYGGDGGLATLAKLHDPGGLALDKHGNIYIADWLNNRIRYVRNTVFVEQNNFTKNIQIYPNPATEGRFTVNVLSDIDESIKIYITDLLGKKIKEWSCKTNNPLFIQLDAPGVYILSVTDGQSILNSKINVIR